MEKKTTRPQNTPNPANNFLQEDFFSKIRGHLVHVYLNNNQDFWATVVGVDVYTVLFAVKDGNGKIIENFLIWKSALAGIKVSTGEVDFQTVRPKNKRIVSPRGYGSDQDLTKTSEKVTDAPQKTQPPTPEPKQEKIEIKEANIEQEKTAPKEEVVVIPTIEQEASEEKETEVKEPKEKVENIETVEETEEAEKPEPVVNDAPEIDEEENENNAPKGNTDINSIMNIFGID